MIRIEKDIHTPRPLEEVFPFIADFCNLPDWDPGVLSSQKTSKGILKEGDTFMLETSFGLQKIPITYTLDKLIPHKEVVYSAANHAIEIVDRIRFSPQANGGTKVQYMADFTPTKDYASFEPFFRLLLSQTGKKAFQGMTRALQVSEVKDLGMWKKFADSLILPGMLYFTKYGYHAIEEHRPAITQRLEGKLVIVTGATSGLGYETALSLARLGATLVLVGRNEEKLSNAKQNIYDETGNSSIETEKADLSLLEQVRNVAERILQKHSKIDILVNNAGYLFPQREITSEGNETSLSLLLLSPYLLSHLLLPGLQQSGNAKIVNVSSGGMYTQKIVLDDLQSEKDYNGSVAYARAKRGLVIATEYLSKTWQKDNIQVNAMHPGWADTTAVQQTLPEFHKIMRGFLRTAKEGADTIIWLAADPAVANISGEFWLDRQIHATEIVPGTSHTAEEKRRLIEELNSLCKL
ncbi:MAG: SDR family NAD(P)-dependent oxidoreductase [Spirochaetota bacterium]